MNRDAARDVGHAPYRVGDIQGFHPARRGGRDTPASGRGETMQPGRRYTVASYGRARVKASWSQTVATDADASGVCRQETVRIALCTGARRVSSLRLVWHG